MIGLTAVALGASALPACAASPALLNHGAVRQLVVDGEPFIVLGGELDNSSASSPAYMRPVWDRMQAMGVNTLLAPVGWDGVWTPGRWLNGDEYGQVVPKNRLGLTEVRLTP